MVSRSDTRNRVEEHRIAVNRLEMRTALLLDPDSIDIPVVGGVNPKVEYILWLVVTHRNTKTKLAYKLVDEYRILQFVTVGGYINRIGDFYRVSY